MTGFVDLRFEINAPSKYGVFVEKRNRRFVKVVGMRELRHKASFMVWQTIGD